MLYNPIQTNTTSKLQKINNILWLFINKTIFRITPQYFSIFRKFRVLCLKIFGAKIEWDVSIHPTAIIEYPWNITIKNKSSIGAKCWIYAMAPIIINKFSCIGNEVKILTGTHDINSTTFDLITKPVSIGEGCWVSTAATILPGINIGNYCVIGTNSVVTKDTNDYDVYCGNPAKFIKKRILD